MKLLNKKYKLHDKKTSPQMHREEGQMKVNTELGVVKLRLCLLTNIRNPGKVGDKFVLLFYKKSESAFIVDFLFPELGKNKFLLF